MTKPIKRTIALMAATALAGGLGGTAHAADLNNGALFYDLNPYRVLSVPVVTSAQGDTWLSAGLMGLDTNRDGVRDTDVYCIEPFVHVLGDINNKGGYFATDWASYRTQGAGGWNEQSNRDRIKWILANSYPNVSATNVIANAGLTYVGGTTDSATVDVEAATQLAIWTLTDNVAVNWDQFRYKSGDRVEGVKVMHDWLVKQSGSAGTASAPEVGLVGTLTGTAGELVGPVQLKNATAATVNTDLPDGLAFTDADGNALGTELAPNQDIYLKVPADLGEGQVTVQYQVTNTNVLQGTVFTNPSVLTQSLIMAKGNATSQVSALTTFSWKASDNPTPDPTEPEAGEPETTEPEADEPETTEPEADEPETTEPENVEPSDPGSSTPGEESAEPEQPEPVTPEPVSPEPEVTVPESHGPEEPQPAPKESTPEPTTPAPEPAAPAPVVKLTTPSAQHSGEAKPQSTPVADKVNKANTAPESAPRMVTRHFQVDRYQPRTAEQARKVAALDDDGVLKYREDRFMWGFSEWQFVTVTVPENASHAEVMAAINAKTQTRVGDINSSTKIRTAQAGQDYVVAWELGRGAKPIAGGMAWGPNKNVDQIFFGRA